MVTPETHDPDAPFPGCETVRDASFPYLDGEEAGPGRAAILTHLRDCPACADHYASAAALQEALPQWTVPVPSADRILRRILQRIHADGEPEVRRSAVLRLARKKVVLPLPLAVAAGLLIAATVVFQSGLFHTAPIPATPALQAGNPFRFASPDAISPGMHLVSGPSPDLIRDIVETGRSSRDR